MGNIGGLLMMAVTGLLFGVGFWIAQKFIVRGRA